MLMSLKKIAIIVLAIHCVLTCYTAYILLVKNFKKDKKSSQKIWTLPDDEDNWNPWGEEFESERQNRPLNKNQNLPEQQKNKWWFNQSLDFGKHTGKQKENVIAQSESGTRSYSIEIWGKAAIGLYLWEHIFNGKLEKKMKGVWSYGYRKIENFKFKFRTGPGLIPLKAPSDVENLILILNGRNEEKVTFAKVWLEFLPKLKYLKNVALVLLGNEQCHNDWLLPYMSFNGGRVNVTFLVYDSPLIDNVHFFQWPLGVATYRNFPKPELRSLDIDTNRPFTCNYVGTIYPHSSRQQLLEIIQQNKLDQFCIVKPRKEWQAAETKESLESYIESLKLSDLTLNPVGMNPECYRIYEAMSFGSVPVVEDVNTPGDCSDSKASALLGVESPLRLLKLYDAPVIYVKHWSELSQVMQKEFLLSSEEKKARRIKIVEWYENFKMHLREQLIMVLKRKFFYGN
ncbi:transmembrane protein 5-like [Limulus polyphemus]|uniref:Transmembrane protein 5-like n=1 Tax=Limulus polyphemus TaxID=6850 RepID=A0ABM1C5M3_LIMPO|nr:transmembrane protein 5-like [Limulus polyphemus]